MEGKICLTPREVLRGLKQQHFCNLSSWLNSLGGLDFGNATTEEFIAPILAPPNHSLVSTTSCLETEINTSFLLNAEVWEELKI